MLPKETDGPMYGVYSLASIPRFLAAFLPYFFPLMTLGFLQDHHLKCSLVTYLDCHCEILWEIMGIIGLLPLASSV